MSYNAFYVNKWPLANCLKSQQQQPCLQGRGTQSDPKMGGGLVHYEMSCRQILVSLCVYACHHTDERLNDNNIRRPQFHGYDDTQHNLDLL